MDHTSTRVLSSQIADLEKLEQSHQIVIDMVMKR